MGKSLGNALAVDEVLKQVKPVELRYHLAAAHYRSTIEFSYESVVESAVGFRRIAGFLERFADEQLPEPLVRNCPEAFVTAMDDDLAVPAAVAVIFDTVRAGNAAVEARDGQTALTAWRHVSAMCSVLGINPLEAPWVTQSDSGSAHAALGALVEAQLAARQQARAAKDWGQADAIRDNLLAAGVQIEDTPDGPVWSLR
jgi:cysteinyl-tRNA synthetase